MIFLRPALPRRLPATILFLLAGFFCLFSQSVKAAPPADAALSQLSQARRLIEQGGFALASGGVTIASHKPQSLFIPASIWKIVTALSALEILGPDYRFKTCFFLDQENTLYIQGQGDPVLLSEEIESILTHFTDMGVQQLNHIVLDDSSFELSTQADGLDPGLDPYNAANSALAANFNTLNILLESGRISSAEAQTPTLAIMTVLGKDLSPGLNRIRISGDRDQILSHTGQLFRALQHRLHIPGQGRIAAGAPPPGLQPFYLHYSRRDLREIIEAMLLYSNNFIANQLFLALGAQQYGFPATWKKSRRAMTVFLEEKMNLKQEEFRVEEGSGISRRNMITPQAMLALLDSFQPYAHLLPQHGKRRLKSGTLNGVYAYAGYFMGEKKTAAFTLILNQKENNRDRLLDIMEEIYREAEKR